MSSDDKGLKLRLNTTILKRCSILPNKYYDIFEFPKEIYVACFCRPILSKKLVYIV